MGTIRRSSLSAAIQSGEHLSVSLTGSSKENSVKETSSANPQNIVEPSLTSGLLMPPEISVFSRRPRSASLLQRPPSSGTSSLHVLQRTYSAPEIIETHHGERQSTAVDTDHYLARFLRLPESGNPTEIHHEGGLVVPGNATSRIPSISITSERQTPIVESRHSSINHSIATDHSSAVSNENSISQSSDQIQTAAPIPISQSVAASHREAQSTEL